MSKTYVSVKIEFEDDKNLKELRDLILKTHPHMKGMKLSKSYLIKQSIALSILSIRKGARMIE